MLEETLLKLKARKYKGRVLVITGSGHHSRGNTKLHPAVKAHLQATGWRPQEATLSDGQGGILIIKI